MSEPGGWNAPDGWGGPSQPPPDRPQTPAPYGSPPPPSGSQPAPYGSPAPPYGSQPAPYGSTAPPYGQPAPYGSPAPPYGQPYAPQGPPPPQAPWGYRPPEFKPGVVPLRPLGLGELLDGAVSIIRRYPRPALGLAAIVSVITALVNAALLRYAFGPFFELDPERLEAGDTSALADVAGAAGVGGLLSLALTLISGCVLTGAMTAIVGRAVLGEPISFGEAWRQVRSSLLRLIGLALISLLMVYGVLIAGVILGVSVIALGGAVLAVVGVPLIMVAIAACVYFYVKVSLASCALVLERASIGKSISRSFTLVKGDFWRVFGILLLTVILAGFVAAIVQIPFAILGAGSPSDLLDPNADPADAIGFRSLAVSAISESIAGTLINPFTYAVFTLLYVDRRMRAEGLDVALTARAHARS